METTASRRLSLGEAARELEVSYSTIRKYRRLGVLKAKWWGGGWTVTREEVAACAERLTRRKATGGRIG